MHKLLWCAGCVLIVATIGITNIPFTHEPTSTPEIAYAGDTLLKRGLTLLAHDSLQEAAIVLRRARAFYPHFSLLHFYLAEASRRAGDMQTAKSEYTQTVEIDHEFYPAYYKLAQLLHEQDDHAAAIQLLETAIVLNPYYREAYRALATIYIDIGDFAAADEVYRRLHAAEEHMVE